MSDHAFNICYPVIVSFINEDEFAVGLGRVNRFMRTKKDYCTNIQPHGEVVCTDPTGRYSKIVSHYRQGCLRRKLYYHARSLSCLYQVEEYTSRDDGNYVNQRSGYFEDGSIKYMDRLSPDGFEVGLQESWYQNGNRQAILRYTDNARDPCVRTGVQKAWYESGQLHYTFRYGEDERTYGLRVGRQECWYENGKIQSVDIYGAAGYCEESIAYSESGDVFRDNSVFGANPSS
jgi:antitoxin component YwqK of YwqJK toxin-antitoxin module